MSAYLDQTRINQLHEIMGAEAHSMIASMLISLADTVERLETVVAAGDLDQAIQAAHAARNDALMLGAAPLQQALRDLEDAARDADEGRAQAMLAHVRAVWPPTRDQLAAL